MTGMMGGMPSGMGMGSRPSTMVLKNMVVNACREKPFLHRNVFEGTRWQRRRHRPGQEDHHDNDHHHAHRHGQREAPGTAS